MIFMTTFLKGPHKQTNDHSLKDSLSPTTLICSPFLSPTESWGEISTSHEEMVTPGTLESQSITQAPPSYFYLCFFFKQKQLLQLPPQSLLMQASCNFFIG